MTDHPRILLVEDDVLTGMMMTDLLEGASFAVDGPYRTLSDAMAALAAGFPDFALLDITLGADDSRLVAEDLERYGIDYAFCSGRPPDGNLFSQLDHPQFLHKPIDPAALIRTVRAATHH